MVVTDTKKESANSSSQVASQPAGTKPGHSSVPQRESNAPIQNHPTASKKLASKQNTSTQQPAQNHNGALAQVAPKLNGQAVPQTAPNTQANVQTQAAAESNKRANVQTQAAVQPNKKASSPQSQQTREQIKKERAQANADVADEQQQEAETETEATNRMRIRLIPIWLRIIIIILAMSFSLLIGTMVGYGVIGGGNAWDVLKQSTWTHIVDIINKE